MERMRGLGGVFLRARDPVALARWYAEHLGIDYRVVSLDRMLAQLRAGGVEVLDRVEELPGVGRFGWATDLEGNRLELWEPQPDAREAAAGE